jgi:4-alpha-glucanotransferase
MKNSKDNLFQKRSSGILLHISSLPGNWGVGRMGHEAYSFADKLHKAGIALWQFLPLQPLGIGSSPYQTCSAFAGNPLFISFEKMQEEGLLPDENLSQLFSLAKDPMADYEYAKQASDFFLALAFRAFGQFHPLRKEYEEFCGAEQWWLDDYSLFSAIRKQLGEIRLQDWPKALKKRDRKSLDERKIALAVEIEYERFVQFVFFRQWNSFKEYCNEKGISLLGDLPIYVSADSVEVWTNPGLFDVDEDLNPHAVAGVPPDYFSETGQLWGNPVYRWDNHESDSFQWWHRRLDFSFRSFDALRIDHFRGFSEFWSISADQKTAVEGKWIHAPGQKLFDTYIDKRKDIPVLAEDLGILSEAAIELRKRYGFPGMKILQFAFSNYQENEFLPHFYDKNCVVYTGTHDNNTLRGWFETEATEEEKATVMAYLGHEKNELVSNVIKLAWSSVANMVIIPMQDLLNLDASCRMNIPGTTSGNWKWRMTQDQSENFPVGEIQKLNDLYSR